MSRASLLDLVLEDGGLRAVFQPIMKLGPDGFELHGVESLTRGPRDTNLESAGVLFEYVRRKHAELPVDRACVRTALEAARSFDDPIPIHVNLHALSFEKDPKLPEFLAAEAEANGIAVSRLTIELVEHGYSWEAPTFFSRVDRLRDLGMSLAIDDVGCGVANFRMILECPADYYKIDYHIVRGVHRDPARRAVLSALARLASDLGAQVVVEGVEDVADLRTVVDLGIVLIQGYLLARPMPIEQILDSGILQGIDRTAVGLPAPV